MNRPVFERFVPSNVSALPLVSTLLAFRYGTPFAVPADSVKAAENAISRGTT